jgi:uncharacterized Zn finger protein (UPF0148 family)
MEKTIEAVFEFWEAGMARHKTNRVLCPLCGNEFATTAEHEEHKKIVHNVMGKKTNLSTQTNPRDLEPADDTPTTELPPGAENTVNQGSTRPSGARAPAKSKGAGR